jgi:hypothetical protein
MDLQRRIKADPKVIAERLLVPSARILVMTNVYKDVINLFDGSMEKARESAYYREHISGQGWHGVSNQNTSSVDFALRQAADTYGLKSAENNWGTIFVSAKALAHLTINGLPTGRFSDHYHVEHTVQNRQRREELVEAIISENMNKASDVAKWILANTVVATIMMEERNDSGTHENTNHRPFWRYAKMGTSVLCWRNEKGFVPATNMTMAEIAMIQTREDPFISRILDHLDTIDDNYHSKLMNEANDFLYNKVESYHQIPKDLSVFVNCDLYELERIHYTHKPTKAKYTG